MHQLKSQKNLSSKYKESTASSLDVASGWIKTEVDSTAAINDKPTKEELKLMSNKEKDVTGKKRKKL